ncbi:MAG: lytic transglycosylase domain-containing protein [Desulfatiglans sp.]|jgi:soluble lytic murein transglycosylase-like protein|nr:lytic transglycosylase domain-containing protein [Desulfatiglans sp.]
METDPFSKYSLKNLVLGMISFLLIFSLIVLPSGTPSDVTSRPLIKNQRSYKVDLISRLGYKSYTVFHSSKEMVYIDIIDDAAERYKIDPALIKAIILAESKYDHLAVSKKGAVGLMQLMPSTADALGVEDIYDPAHNINAGVKYIKHLLELFNGDVKLALAAYNAGSNKVRKYNGIPPYKATKTYIKKVFEYYWSYQLASQA